ncbi:hypothetical protein SELMODRAFT_136631 [Selaginella moellendorffii]|uniref:Cystinosin homolog n=1 Tax=Selaginella moellendorffii TaxID=88036 RepID=D8TC09_SELML|nr:cystinosin homolog [Selaginella moellendorffii]EFJ05760.1 hypothetical protein SELMODRAFT_136631 [Selaginella moellendorffii]|eukprot:XP_002993120.1 cystinosin homolog [Selaginella moellendorffii]
MASWHSSALAVIYQILGWFAFTVWSISFYPQVLLNFRRKSVVGLNFDFLLLNFTKHSSYLIYNAAVFFSPVVQRQYHDKYGADEMIPVAPNDIAFSIHAVLLTGFTILQVFLYERGGQRVSKAGALVSLGAWLAGLICLIVAFPSGRWLWLVQVFNIIQLVMTAIKYIPQAWMNFRRKSTVGWSIGNILLDLSGGIANILQMAVQSIDQHSTENFSGNVGKLGLSLESIAFDILFVFQHYFLYYEADKVEEVAANTYEALENDPEQAKTSEEHPKNP